jgi:nucleotide-binding universal stress UspA family protein
MSDAAPILIAYDGSEHARAAIERAATLLRPRTAVVICVWAPISSAAAAATLGASASVAFAGAEKLDAAGRERAQQLAGEGAELARGAGLEAESRAVETVGAVWRGIVRCAGELDAAAIVTGTRGRSGVAAALLGSTAQGVLHNAGRPVLVASGTGDETPRSS